MVGMDNGEVIGAGLGAGFPQLSPLDESDFRVEALGEELGLAGFFFQAEDYIRFLVRSRGLGNMYKGQGAS